MTTRVRLVMPLILIAGLLGPVAVAAQAATAAARTFAISVAETGPFAPGAAVTVAVSGGVADAFGLVQQCNANNNVCGPTATFTLDATGSATTTLRVHRRIGSPERAVDCAVAPCQLTARTFEGDTAASTPISIDASVPIVPPVLTVEGPRPLPDRARVTVHGRGFDPSAGITLRECAGARATQCLDTEIGFGFTDANGSFDVAASVGRVIAGTDCADRPNRCRIWALPDGNVDQIAAAGLQFDATNPPVVPHATVTPATNLRHQQTVTVAGTHFFPSTYGQIEQCVDAGGPSERCRYLSDVSTGGNGAFIVNVAVARRVGLADCAVAACVMRVRVYPTDLVDVALAFDSSVPPPPVPSVAVIPHEGLVDRQVVDVRIRGAEPGTYVYMSLCSANGSSCRGNVSDNINDAVAVIPMALPRVLAPGVDCAVVKCVLNVQLYGGDSYEFKVPVGFDPNAPLAGSATVNVFPARGLWDHQRVEVRGERFDPGTDVSVQQCVSANAPSPGACSTPRNVLVDNTGTLSTRFTVLRTLQLSDGAHDCAAVTCYLVVDGEPPTALALAFDPAGPLHGSDLPPQLKCVAWPTAGWPTGPLPAGVDPARVEAVGAQMVGPNRGDSVVVIHGGRLVYEKYRDGVTANSILASFSMSKSFTSTVIGMLVDDGRLQLDGRAPIREWADPSDPRHAITLRNILNMSSGLQWNEDYFNPQSDVVRMVGAADEAAYVIAKPLEVTPGSRWHYSTGDTEVLGHIIGETANVSGATYNAYLHKRLFDPLGINPVEPGFDDSGNWNAGWRTNTTTRNFAKLGLLYLRDGVWENKQFLSSSWVDFVRTPTPSYSGYGGQFWLNGDGSFRMVGLEGQTVHIIPELDLIVAVNNGGGDQPMVDLFRNAESPSCGDAATAADDTATVRALGHRNIDVLANDHGGDVGFAPATLTVSDAASHGSTEVVGNRIRYDAGEGFTGTDSFGYVVCTKDRQRCVEAHVTVHVKPLVFAFRPPVRNHLNLRSPERSVLIRFRMPEGEPAVKAVTSVAVDCASGKTIGAHEPVDAQLHVNARRGLVSFRWSTTPTWTGCRDLEVALADGQVYTAHFRWRTRD